MDIPKDQTFMALRRAWIVEQFACGLVKGFHCHTSNMLADANNKDHTVEHQAVNARNLQGHGKIDAVSTVLRHAYKPN